MKTNSRTLDLITRAIRNGQTAKAIEMRKALYREVSNGSFKGHAREWEAKARAAQLFIVMAEKMKAARCLCPLIETHSNNRIRLNPGHIGAMGERGTGVSFAVGLFLAQAANLLYRSFQYKEGISLAKLADAHLSGDDRSTEYDRLLALCENRIWLSRLLIRYQHHAKAESLLQKTMATLYENSDRPGDTGGIDLLLGISLDLKASFEWTTGDLNEARRHIYKAVYILSRKPSRDPIRLAHSLFIAARVEATQAGNTRWSGRILNDAIRLYDENGHPFQCRAEVLMAQNLVRSGELLKARERIDSVRKLLEEPELDDDEKFFVEGDCRLAEAWRMERLVRDGKAVWSQHLKAAKELYDHRRPGSTGEADDSGHPPRLELESRLQYGKALVHSGRLDDIETGRKLLGGVVKKARSSAYRKIEIAAHFTLAESWLEFEPNTAKTHYRDGRRRLANVESNYLQKWSHELGRRFGFAPRIEINPDLTLHVAIASLKAGLLDHYDRKAEGDSGMKDKEIAAKLGITERTLGRLRKSIGWKRRSLKLDETAN